jgi:hypothetical protein
MDVSNHPLEQPPTTSNLMCAYGDQGSGKSSLIATAPLDWLIHIIDIDDGLEPAKRAWKRRGGDLKQWSIVDGLTDYKKLHAALWNIPEGKNLYVIDTYTTAMKVFKAYVQQNKIEITDWMKVGGKVAGLAIDYFDHFRRQVAANKAWGLVLCQDKMKDIGGGDMKYCPDLVGAAGRDVAGMVSFLFHYERRKVSVKGSDGKNRLEWERVLRTQENGLTMAKDRSEALAAPFEVPDLTVITQKVTESRAKEDL